MATVAPLVPVQVVELSAKLARWPSAAAAAARRRPDDPLAGLRTMAAQQQVGLTWRMRTGRPTSGQSQMRLFESHFKICPSAESNALHL